MPTTFDKWFFIRGFLPQARIWNRASMPDNCEMAECSNVFSQPVPQEEKAKAAEKAAGEDAPQ